LIYTSQDVR